MMKKDRAIVMKVTNLTEHQAAKLIGKALGIAKASAPESRFLGAMQDARKQLTERR